MKKRSKSLQAVIITFLVGLFVPKIFDLTGIALLDKVVWKIVLSLSFNIATVVVGILYSAKLLHSKSAGGKTRIAIYLIIVLVFLCATTSILVFFNEVAKIVLIIMGAAALVVVSAIILNYVFTVKRGNNKVEIHRVKNNSTVTKPNHMVKQDIPRNKPQVHNSIIGAVEETPKQIVVDEKSIKLKTAYKLWYEFDKSEKCLTITNNENPDLKWVKIYKAPYSNGKFYGYIMMKNARNTVSGEIYFADKPIWQIY